MFKIRYITQVHQAVQFGSH
uniref:Uncharacterized protein n=1 Tax=Arundo donax TaxID=35708 RepID=A0A0A9U088_ARUDO